ncbi:MAG: hypothetical protein M1457_11835 [bacterium]|nr:hypothetical protein [bacterium]
MLWIVITLNTIILMWVAYRLVDRRRRQVLAAFAQYARLKLATNFNLDALGEKDLLELVCRELRLKRLEIRLPDSRVLVADPAGGFSVHVGGPDPGGGEPRERGMVIRQLGLAGGQATYVFEPGAPAAEAPVVAACLDEILSRASFRRLRAPGLPAEAPAAAPPAGG